MCRRNNDIDSQGRVQFKPVSEVLVGISRFHLLPLVYTHVMYLVENLTTQASAVVSRCLVIVLYLSDPESIDVHDEIIIIDARNNNRTLQHNTT